MNYKVHVGYGFHVNCYHSYRGDSNDELGFGGDIRIIRKIIDILNSLNERGIPVKGTWDFENVYSLEEILPQYAPDIIENVRERVKKYGDENDIMGYNNGALSAMTRDEFKASIEWAITNPKGSGLLDVFGEYAPVVRPQEVMFTPSQVRAYNELGIEAVCLYYSCVPFDAFRTIIPQLPDEQAFNPVTYSYAGESITVLPTYSNADVMDAGTLRYLVKDLHQKQLAGEINNDVFILINMDADAILWEPLGLPFPLNKMANTEGIRGLVEEVADLDFVVFDTPGGYLKNHKPLAEISFGHDTADGSFSGYSSWTEKPFNRQIWTRLEKARAYARAAKQDWGSPSFEERIKLLSTTHFGLASPVLNIDRERAALKISETMLQKEAEAQQQAKRHILANPNNSTLVSAQISFDEGFLPDIRLLSVINKDMETFGAVAADTYQTGSVKTAFLICRFKKVSEQYPLTFAVQTERPAEAGCASVLATENMKMKFCGHGEILSVIYKGKRIGGKNFLRSYLTYDGKTQQFSNKRLAPLPAAGALSGCSVTGDITLPEALKNGSFAFDFFILPGTDCIFVHSRVQYPYTKEENSISTHSSALGRYSDMKWHQAVPFQITPALSGDISVVKRNFEHDISSYPVSSFWESVPQNTSLASFNNHLTSGMVALSNGETGLAVANARQVLCSMAHCPMKLRRQEGQAVVSMNPFGTYYGKQRVHPTRSNGAVGEAFVLVTPQSRSLAAAYNGARETSVMALFAYDGTYPGGEVQSDINGFADGGVLLGPAGSPVKNALEDNVSFEEIRLNTTAPGNLKPVTSSGVASSPLDYAKIGVGAFGNIVRRQIKAAGKKKV
ncbi:MAG: hypothetical protein LBS36_03750 [Oscillospiraceae bacterium]|jgi:hypothetical protein|nr:hypothetical protein [Oscillospiraceae bacterium]